MKQLGVLGLIIFVAFSAQAEKYSCFTAEGTQSLNLSVNYNRVGAFAQAELVAEEGNLKFSGFKQEFDTVGDFNLTAEDGTSALLKISKFTAPGDGCGRCAPSFKLKTYAKLVLAQKEYDFTCNSVALIPEKF